MNICLISTGYFPENGGGIGTYIHNLSQGLVKLGHVVHVFTSTEQSNDTTDKVNGVFIHRFVKRTLPIIEHKVPGLFWSLQLYLAIKKQHKKSAFDLIEFPNWEAPGFISQYLMNIPIVVRLHTPFFETLSLDSNQNTFGDKFTCWLEEKSCKKAQQLVASTHCHAKTIIDEYHINKADIEILPLGIVDKTTEKQANQLTDNRFRMLYVSRLENRKGTLAFLTSLPEIYKQYKNIQVDIIGSDRPHAPGGVKFQQYFKQHFNDLSEVVTFHGFVDDETLDSFYKKADVFVVPSVYESFGLIYVEAMMYSLPSIATIGGGIPEVITDGVDGFLTDINDSEQISTRVLELINDDQQRNKVAVAARQSFIDKFEYLIMSTKTENLYQNIITQYAK